MTFGLALSHLFYAFAPSWHLILVGALVQSLCRVYNPALRALIADSIPPERRGMAYSINSLIMGVSTTPAPLIAGLLFVKFGLVPSMKITYLLVTVFYLLAAFLRIRLKETIESPSRINVSELFGAYPQAIKETLSVWREVPRSMLYLLVSDVFASFGFSLFLPYVVVYAVEDLNIPKFQWSILMTILFVSMLLLALPAGKLVDRFGRKNPILLSSALFPAAMLLLVYGDFTKLVFALPLVGLGQVLAQSAYPSLVTDLTPKNLRGRVMGSSSFFNIIVSAAGNLVGGLLYQNLSHRIIFILPIVLLVPQMLIILFLVHEPKEREV